MAKSFGVAQIASLLNVSIPRIHQLVELGMPKVGRGRYNPADCMMWMLRHQQAQLSKRGLTWKDKPTSLLEARRRKLSLQAERAEYELEKERAQVIPLEYFNRHIEEKFAVVRQRLLALPASLAPQLEGGTRTEIRHKLSVAVRGTLTALAQGEH
jgi:phage terminase Nu1 subunit (DNA packaging protein)